MSTSHPLPQEIYSKVKMLGEYQNMLWVFPTTKAKGFV